MPQKKSTTRSTAKKPASRKKTVSATAKKRSAKASVQSFRRTPESEAFFVFRLSRQTIYWLVLGAIVVAFTAWIYKLQSDIQAIYDQIDQTVVVDQQSQPSKRR